MRRKVLNPVTPSDWEHSKLAIQETGGWIKNADTKATILAGSFGLSLTFAVPRLLEALPSMLAVPFALGIWISAATVFFAAALITGYQIASALIPRTSLGTSLMNRFAWPSLAIVAPDQLPPKKALSANDIRDEAWEQAVTLAQIAKAKYHSFKIALIAFCVYLVALVAMVAIQTVAATL